MTLELSEPESKLLDQAADRSGTSPAAYARYAALRMAQQDLNLSVSEQSLHGHAAPAPPTRRSLRQVIHRATIPTVEIVRQLQTFLGPRLLGRTLDAEVETIDSWARGERSPSPVHERRLREAHEAWQLVCIAEAPDTARAWWMGMKDALDDLSPAEAIALDRGRDVMAVARAYVESG